MVGDYATKELFVTYKFTYSQIFFFFKFQINMRIAMSHKKDKPIGTYEKL